MTRRQKWDSDYYQKNKKKYHQWYLTHKEKVYSRNDQRAKKVRKWIKEYKSNLKCEICGESHPATLDFHHRDPMQKSFSVATLVTRRAPIKKLQEEINKCAVLCSNCHRKLHYYENDDTTRNAEGDTETSHASKPHHSS